MQNHANCGCCDGTGKVDRMWYSTVDFAPCLHVVYTGEQIVCPGCDGSGQSDRSKGNAKHEQQIN